MYNAPFNFWVYYPGAYAPGIPYDRKLTLVFIKVFEINATEEGNCSE